MPRSPEDVQRLEENLFVVTAQFCNLRPESVSNPAKWRTSFFYGNSEDDAQRKADKHIEDHMSVHRALKIPTCSPILQKPQVVGWSGLD